MLKINWRFLHAIKKAKFSFSNSLLQTKQKITLGVNFTMAKECFICSKKKVAGNQVSHSHIATKRTWGANLQKKSIEVDGKIQNEYICTRCLKTLKNEEK